MPQLYRGSTLFHGEALVTNLIQTFFKSSQKYLSFHQNTCAMWFILQISSRTQLINNQLVNDLFHNPLHMKCKWRSSMYKLSYKSTLYIGVVHVVSQNILQIVTLYILFINYLYLCNLKLKVIENPTKVQH